MPDLRFAFRQLLKNPGFTAVAVLTLALGIGANTAIFSVVNAVLLRPLPFKAPERLVFISEKSRHMDNMSVAYPNFLDWQKQDQVFDDLAAFRFQSYNVTGASQPERVDGFMVSASFFTTLGITPLVGRVFRADEDRAGAERTVVLSEGLWRRRFGGDADTVGKPITLDGEAYTIVGVLPAAFQFPRRVELWTPLGLPTEWTNNRGWHPGTYVVGRLKSGLTVGRARQGMELIAARLAEQYPDTNTGNSVTVMPLRERLVGEIQPALLMLLAAVGFVLLIACANVANLLLARSAARAKEIAIRATLGAGRWRIARQLLVESIVLGLVGGAAGLVLAYWGVDVLTGMIPRVVAELVLLRVDGKVLAFAFAVAATTGLIFGLVPAWQAARTDLNEVLNEGGRSEAAGFGRHYFRRFLIVAEVALALVLLIGACLLIRSFGRLQAVSPGIDGRNVLTLEISLPTYKYPKAEDRARFYQEVLRRVATLPGVQSAGVIMPLPLGGGGWQTGFVVEGQPRPKPGQGNLTDIAIASPDYFRAMGVQLLRGRAFTEQDTTNSQRVVMIDETFAKRFWPNQDPLGKRVALGDGENPEWRTIVGVVAHVKNYGVDSNSRIEMYRPVLQDAPSGVSLVLRTTTAPHALANPAREAVYAVDKDQPVANVRTMEELLADSVASRRLAMLLLGVFAAVAMALAAVGIYGVTAYSVSQRTREIGIRLALGAEPADVLGLVLRQGAPLVLLGVGTGWLAAFWLTRLMKTLLFGITTGDLPSFITMPALLALVALLAAFIPARRATRVDPMMALRYE